ncbi:Aste57867_14806 [Aphanomyces stellatus]|uniref:Aste57867_14806 protein n=1 Tax=Aphanomyces stellatus TaxID=120398 RepID=A0A485L1N8_9STRA|nr:hypothetical protein As57867_014751 [Aphanomyces stellatus]VFT91624.1 Aste57867_14806 [Aphanomyces stellatus]
MKLLLGAAAAAAFLASTDGLKLSAILYDKYPESDLPLTFIQSPVNPLKISYAGGAPAPTPAGTKPTVAPTPAPARQLQGRVSPITVPNETTNPPLFRFNLSIFFEPYLKNGTNRTTDNVITAPPSTARNDSTTNAQATTLTPGSTTATDGASVTSTPSTGSTPAPNTATGTTAAPKSADGSTPAPNTATGATTTSPSTAGSATPAPNTATPSPNSNGGSTPSPNAAGFTPSPNSNGGSTPSPNAAGSTPAPNAATGSTPAPNAASGSTPSPNSNGGTTNSNGGSTPSPNSNGGATPAPNAAGSTPSPNDVGSTPAPNAATGSTPSPNSNGGATTSTNSNGGSTPAPNTASGSTPSPNSLPGTNVNAADATKPVDVLAILRQQAQQSTDTSANNNYRQLSAIESMVTLTDSSKPAMNGRRRLAASDFTLNLMFCNAQTNALVSYVSQKPSATTSAATTTLFGSKEPDADGLCYDYTVKVDTVSVTAGCNAQNSPNGCGDVYNPGCGGLSVDPTSKQLYVARTGGRSIGKLNYVQSQSCDGRVLDWLVRFRGKRFNGPADVTFTSLGNLYFTDSPFALASTLDEFLSTDVKVLDSKRELPFNGVFLRTSTTTTVLDATMTRPRSIAFSPDEDVMYVANADAKAPYVKVFQLTANGTKACGQTFFDFKKNPRNVTGLTSLPNVTCVRQYPTSVKVDSDGFVYVVMCNNIYAFDPAGELLGRLEGDAEIHTISLATGYLLIDSANAVYALPLDTAFGNSQPLVANPHTNCAAKTTTSMQAKDEATSSASSPSSTTLGLALVGGPIGLAVVAAFIVWKKKNQQKTDERGLDAILTPSPSYTKTHHY